MRARPSRMFGAYRRVLQGPRVVSRLVAHLLSNQSDSGRQGLACLGSRNNDTAQTPNESAFLKQFEVNGRKEMLMRRIKSSKSRIVSQIILLLFWSATAIWASEPKVSS